MKTFIYHISLLFAAFAALLSVSSCDKVDDNGDFYAYWLLTDATDGNGPLGERPDQGVAGIDNDNLEMNLDKNITWAVRNELIMLRDYQHSDYYFFTFTRDAHSLQLTAAFHNDGSNDTKIEFADVPPEFFIPTDGHFEIVTLDSKSMVLHAGDVTLTFKRN